jgi:ankyrin repeat protein
LVEHGADVNGWDVLPVAARNDDIEIVKCLVEHGADVKAGDNDALRYAVKENHQQIVQYLIQNGADANARGVYSFIKCLRSHSQIEQ